MAVVGNEAAATGFGQPRLHHRMAPGDDLYAWLFDKHRFSPVQRERAFGQRAQRVQRGDGARQPAQRGHKFLQLVEQLFVQEFLAGQRALLRRQRLVFKSLELGCDEALGVFQGLATPVVVGHLAGLALRDLDVKTVHAVELHAQIGNAGAGSFAGFEVQQKGVTVGLYAAQLVQVSVAAVVDHAAVTHQRRRLVQQVAPQQGRAGGWGLQVFKNLL